MHRFPSALLLALLVLLGYIAHLHYLTRTKNDLSSLKKASPKGNLDKFAILTMTTGENSYDWISHSNKNFYARKHGYDLIIDYAVPDNSFSTTRGAVWHKFEMVETALKSTTPKYDWVWWIDYDTLITNTSIKLENIVRDALGVMKDVEAEKVDMLLTADCFPLNAGSMLFRNTPFILSFITSVRAWCQNDGNKTEQDCMHEVLLSASTRELYKNKVLWIPQTTMNSFPEEIKCWDKDEKGWEKGQFVVHFAGAWAHIKGDDPYGQLMRKYKVYIDK